MHNLDAFERAKYENVMRYSSTGKDKAMERDLIWLGGEDAGW